jgi:hypothetical protein
MSARALRAPVFLSSLPRKQGAAHLPPPNAASLLLIRPPKIYKIYRTWAAHVKGFFLSIGPHADWRRNEMWGHLPPPRPSQLRWSFQQYFGVKIMYRCDHTPEFFRFFLFVVFGSFLFVILCFFLSPFYFILIHLFLSFSSYLFLLFSSYILNCLLYYRHDKSVILMSFSRWPSLFDPFWVKVNVSVRPYVLTFFCFILYFVFWSFLLVTLFLFFSSHFSSYSTLLIFKLFIVLQTCIINTHWEKEHK